MANCGKCGKLIQRKSIAMQCGGCSILFHAGCVGVSSADAEKYINDHGLLWKCFLCRRKGRPSAVMVEDTNVYTSSASPTTENFQPSLEDIFNEIKLLREEQKSTQRTIESFYDELELLRKQLNEQNTQMKTCVEEVEKLKSVNKSLSEKNYLFMESLNDMEQHSRNNIIELTGVPEKKGESVHTVVQQVCEAVGFKLESTMVDTCHRMRYNSAQSSEPRNILVKFLRNADKRELLKCRRVRREFSTSELAGELKILCKEQKPIYINENLTKSNRILFAKTRQVKKDKNYKYLWINSGKILLKKSDESKTILIKSVEDLHKIK